MPSASRSARPRRAPIRARARADSAQHSGRSPRPGHPARPGLLRALASPGDALGFIGPNWYASVMGTGIVATAAARLPIGKSTFHPFAVAVWVIAALLLILVTIAVVLHWVRFPATARSHARNPTMAPFYGAPPMALMTVGTGTLLLGRVVIGGAAALDVDWVLWSLGTVTGLLCTAAIPYLLFTQHEVQPDGAFGGWLMPIVPPMVSAANGALLIPHLHGAHAQATMLYGCYAMFGMSLVTAFIVITLIWSRLAHYGTSGSSRVPTLWIVLGPLGQSITAVGLLGTEAHLAVGPALSSALSTFAVLYGVPVFGFALLWSVLAAALTVRAIRGGMSFALTWWSFTFPVGTCVTGVTGLAIHTGLPAFRWAALIAFVALLAAWLTVAIQTVWGSVAGDLFLAPTADGPVRAAKAPVVS